MRIKVDVETMTVTIPKGSGILVDVPNSWIIKEGYRQDAPFVAMLKLRKFMRTMFNRNNSGEPDVVQFNNGSTPSLKIQAISYIRNTMPELGGLKEIKEAYEAVDMMTEWHFSEACKEHGW